MKSLPGEIERIQKLIESNPQSTQFARLAEYLLQADRISEAIEICKNGLEHNTNYANGHFVLGHCYFNTQNFDSAESEFNKTLLHDSEHLQAHHFQAKIMKERGWQNAYLLWLKRILTIDPMDRLASSLLEGISAEDMVQIEVNQMSESSDAIKEDHREDQQIEDRGETIETDFVEQPVEGIEKTEVAGESSEEKGGKVLTSEEEEERYEFILDDIFKDEVAQEESSETSEEEIESSDEIADISKEKEDFPVDVITESLEEDDEIVAQITESVEQFEEEEPFADDEIVETSTAEIEEISFEGKEEAISDFIDDVDVSEKEESIEIESAAEKVDIRPEPVKADTEESKEKKTPSLNKEPIVTSTLGEIYAAQGHFAKAISVYEILLKKNPGNQFYEEKIEDLKQKKEESDRANRSD